MIKIVKTELNKALNDMGSTFANTYEVLAEYEAEKKQIQAREKEIQSQLQELGNKHLQILSDREQNKHNMSDYLYLSKMLESLKTEEQILRSLMEQIKEDYQSLKLKYASLIASSHTKELGEKKAQFDVNEVIQGAIYEAIKATADYARALREENNKVMPLLDDFNDSIVLEANPQMRHVFNYEASTLPYWQANKTVLHRESVRLACTGAMDPEVKPKGGK